MSHVIDLWWWLLPGSKGLKDTYFVYSFSFVHLKRDGCVGISIVPFVI
jgi:hypothetical protein